MIQCGDPKGDGTGGPGYEFEDELPAEGAYKLGSLAMANSGPNTNGSQFFVISGAQGTQLPPQYSLFGQVTDGLDTTISTIAALATPGADGPPSQPVQIQKVTITESEPAPIEAERRAAPGDQGRRSRPTSWPPSITCTLPLPAARHVPSPPRIAAVCSSTATIGNELPASSNVRRDRSWLH